MYPVTPTQSVGEVCPARFAYAAGSAYGILLKTFANFCAIFLKPAG
jgi:hypothetical protein